MTPTVNQLRYFVAVAEAGQISRAARELLVSQSAVTTAIQDLERHLRERVFSRSSRGVTLTQAGAALLPKARDILQMLTEASQIATVHEEVEGTVRVGASYTVMGYFVPQHLHRIHAQFPRLQIHWQELDRPLIQERVAAGDLDFGLLLTSNLDHPGLAHETFVHSRRRLWLAPRHPLADRDEIHLDDVADHPYALLTVDEAARTAEVYWGSHWADLFSSILLATSSIEAIRSIVANGDAVTVLSDMVYRPWSLEGKRLETRVLADYVPDMNVGLAWKRNVDFTPSMTALHEYFYRVFLLPTEA
jgi:DNA-binding transcriptional LysR family regulator